MAHKKGGGSSRNGRDSNAQRLGVKCFGGEHVISGNIIVRQHGTKFHPGENVGVGKDHTLFATIEGFVVFERMRGRDGQKRISVYPESVIQAAKTGNGAGSISPRMASRQLLAGKSLVGSGTVVTTISKSEAPAAARAAKKAVGGEAAGHSSSSATASKAVDDESRPAAVVVAEETTVAIPVASRSAKTKSGADDLKIIEGIGPKMESALHAAGIDSFAKLAKASEAELLAAVEAAGMRLAPTIGTWAQQADFIVRGDMDGLKAFQDQLGRRS